MICLCIFQKVRKIGQDKESSIANIRKRNEKVVEENCCKKGEN